MSDFLNLLSEWFEGSMAGSSIWSVIGVGCVALMGLWGVGFLVRGIYRLWHKSGGRYGLSRRTSEQGYAIGLVAFTGPGGNRQSRALYLALQTHLGKFTFGAPFQLIRVAPLRAKRNQDLRRAAVRRLISASADLIVWGYTERGQARHVQADILSLEGSLSASEAHHSVGLLPHMDATNADLVGLVNAYLIARALLPGLATATAYKSDRIAPIAEILLQCLNAEDGLPARTVQTLELDYCAMALHLGQPHHFENVIKLQRARLLAVDAEKTPLPVEIDIQTRVDLGRALLKSSAVSFDPARVREAVEQLKIAIELLKTNPILQLATATSASVQEGQSLLANRKRFSVTGGTNL